MKLILLGPPGSGKGTQAAAITDKFNIPQISTGDMLRAAVREGTPLGLEVKKVMDTGGLVQDGLIIQLVKERLQAADCRSGYLFDGFPRTLPQAEAMRTASIALNFVLEISVPDEEIVTRMSGRRVHLASGRSFHVLFNPPREEGKDDVTGEPLVQRDDDRKETVLKRLDVFHQQTRILTDYYRQWSAEGEAAAPQYRKVDGLGEVKAVSARVHAALQ